MQKNWYRLDTGALIFPAIARSDWCNVFRCSAGLCETVDPEVLQQAADDLRDRFPSFFVTLRKGLFWYYLEESKNRLTVRPDYAYPLTFMSKRELKQNCVRVLYYRNRIAVEFFHSVSDGRGGFVFLCNLTARYLELKHGMEVPHGDIIKDITGSPRPEELEDSFVKNASETAAKRETERSYRLRGEKDPQGFKHLVTGVISSSALVDAAHGFGVSVTAFLAAVMAKCVMDMQDMQKPRKRQRPVKITIPVDMRRLFASETLRNFALVLNLGVDPRFGDYSLKELCNVIWHQLNAQATRQNMSGMIASNVQPRQAVLIRLTPVFVKNLVMDMIYRRSGEGGGSLNVSNLGNIELPGQMRPYIDRLEFIIGPQRSYPNNCSVVSYGGRTCINMIRNIRTSELERRFFSSLVELGIAVDVESNGR